MYQQQQRKIAKAGFMLMKSPSRHYNLNHFSVQNLYIKRQVRNNADRVTDSKHYGKLLY